MHFFRSTLVVVVLLLLTNCESQVKFYQNNKPVMNFISYFCGESEGYGISFDITGKATMRFKINAKGNCETSGMVKIDEQIMFEDGSIETKHFEASMIDENTITVVGEGIEKEGKMKQYGNAAHLEYDKIIRKGMDYDTLSVANEMYMIDDVQMISKVKMKKLLVLTDSESFIVWKKK